MRRAWLAALALGLLAPAPARANGRYPQSNQVYFSETDPDLVVVRATFGLLLSADRGHTFDWICEASVGFYYVEDPMYAFTPTNRIVVSTYGGVRVSPDRGCSFQLAPLDSPDHVFVDLAARPGRTGEIALLESWVNHLDSGGLPVYESQLWETKDEGRTLAKLGPALDSKLLALTVDLTKTDPDRIYLTAKTGTRDGQFLLSRDRGLTWESTPIALGERDLGVFIAGVDPTNPNRVYLRTGGNANDVPAQLMVVDVGQNAAATTVTTVYTGVGVLPGFALSPDGKKIYVGGPLDGVRAANTTDFAFETRSNLETYCLGINGDGLWGCSTTSSGIALALSTDEGRTFTKRLDFCDVRGPLSCRGGTNTTDTCAPLWPLQRSLFGCSTTTPDAGTTSPVDGGASAGPSSAPASANGLAAHGSGCDCRMGAPSSALGWAGAGLAAIAALVRRRQRKSVSP